MLMIKGALSLLEIETAAISTFGPRRTFTGAMKELGHLSSPCVRRAKLSRARAGVRRSVELSGVARKRTTLFAPRRQSD